MRRTLWYPLNVAHKARYALAVGLEDARYRALAAALEIANIPQDLLPEELRQERRAILDLANRYERPRDLRKKTGSRLAAKIYDFCTSIEQLYRQSGVGSEARQSGI